MEHISDTDIDRIAERIEAKGSGARVIRHGNDGGFRKLIDGLLIIGIAALIGVVWTLSNNVAVLTTQMTYVKEELQAVRAVKP
jgi:hypothetical protein